MTEPLGPIWRIIIGRDVSLRFTVICLFAFLASCGPPNPPNERALDQQMMNVTTSPIPGAQAKVLPAPPGTAATGQPANFCVTDAGYCPLAAATPAGQNCLCAVGNLAYGGQTAAAPQTIPYTPPIKFLGTQNNGL
jgi:hypothetical protein